MKKVLFITANPKSESQSFSLEAGRKFIETYKRNNPDHEVKELDLYQMEIPFIDEDVLDAWGRLGSGEAFDELPEAAKEKVAAINGFNDEFVQSDKYIFVTPLWNFSLPPKMKLYIDTLMITGKTFKYTESGPVGLLEGKKALHVHASGGIYSEGPAKIMDFGNSYLKAVLGFMGVTDVQEVLLEGTNMVTDGGAQIREEALVKIDQLAYSF